MSSDRCRLIFLTQIVCQFHRGHTGQGLVIDPLGFLGPVGFSLDCLVIETGNFTTRAGYHAMKRLIQWTIGPCTRFLGELFGLISS